MEEHGIDMDDERKRAALDDFLEDHEVDGKLHDLYNRMVEPSDDTPELVKKISDHKKVLGKKLKSTSDKIKTSATDYTKKVAQEQASRKKSISEADALLGRLQAPKTYEPPKRGVTRLNITEGFIAAKAPVLVPIDTKKAHHIRMPKVHIPRLHVPHFKSLIAVPIIKIAPLFAKGRKKYTIAAMAVVLMLIIGMRSIATTRNKIAGKTPVAKTGSTKKGSAPAVAGDTITKPDYPTLVPSNNTSVIKDSTRFDASKRVATFQDSLNGSRLVISQQQIGSAQTGDATFLSKLATNMYLKTQMDTDNGPAYLGTNLEQHIQTVAFVKGDLLVFIQSQNVLDVSVWTTYINGLKLP